MINKLYNYVFKKGEFSVFSEKPQGEIIHVHQIHSADIVEYTGADISNIEADGIICDISNLQNKILAIKTADCLPILFLSHEKVALIHAGWKGVQSHIHLDQKLIDMKPHTILIGPSIQKDQFEVSQDFQNNFQGCPHFSKNNNDHLTFNLQQYVHDGLKEVYPSAQIIDDQFCTVLDHKLHSYRRDKTAKRNWNTYTIE